MHATPPTSCLETMVATGVSHRQTKQSTADRRHGWAYLDISEAHRPSHVCTSLFRRQEQAANPKDADPVPIDLQRAPHCVARVSNIQQQKAWEAEQNSAWCGRGCLTLVGGGSLLLAPRPACGSLL